MSNILKDLAKLTTIPEFNLVKLCNLTSKCISHEIVEAIKTNNDYAEINIGIGTLLINIEDKTNIKFKFFPSTTLQNNIVNSLENNESELVLDVEELLKEKIMFTYKNLL